MRDTEEPARERLPRPSELRLAGGIPETASRGRSRQVIRDGGDRNLVRKDLERVLGSSTLVLRATRTRITLHREGDGEAKMEA